MKKAQVEQEIPSINGSKLEILPLTPDRWTDLETLFGPHGAYGGCWCMWWRIKRSQFEQQQGEGNRAAMKSIVDSGEVPGLLAYVNGQPAGWCSVAPRLAFPALDRSRILARVDAEPVWSIVCFYIARKYRRQGITIRLLKAAVEYAQSHGAKVVEGYPKDPQNDQKPDPFVFTGLVSAFRQAGFIEVMRRSDTRPIMRYFAEAD
jgi:GNAT superfamily N-acetyltransferase